MSRSLRNKQRAPLIDISDSEEDIKSSAKDNDSDFEIEEEIVKNDRKTKPESSNAPKMRTSKFVREIEQKENSGSSNSKDSKQKTRKTEVIGISSDEEMPPQIEKENSDKPLQESKSKSRKRKQKEPSLMISEKQKKVVRTKSDTDESDVVDIDIVECSNKTVKNESSRVDEDRLHSSSYTTEYVECSESEQDDGIKPGVQDEDVESEIEEVTVINDETVKPESSSPSKERMRKVTQDIEHKEPCEVTGSKSRNQKTQKTKVGTCSRYYTALYEECSESEEDNEKPAEEDDYTALEIEEETVESYRQMKQDLSNLSKKVVSRSKSRNQNTPKTKVVEMSSDEEKNRVQPSFYTTVYEESSSEDDIMPAVENKDIGLEIDEETVGSNRRIKPVSPSPLKKGARKVTRDIKRKEPSALSGSKSKNRKTPKSQGLEISPDNETMPEIGKGDAVQSKQTSKPTATKRKQKQPTGTIAVKRKKMIKVKENTNDTDIVDNNDENVRDETLEDDKSTFKPSSDTKASFEWSESEYISEVNDIDRQIAENIVKLLKDDNTIPFIARYRKEMTGRMEPEQLRTIKDSYDHCKLIKQRAATIIKSIDKLGKWSPEIHTAISAAKSLAELDHIYGPYKPGSKRSLAERAKELGLGPISNAVLAGYPLPPLSSLINPSTQGLKTEDQIKDGIMHIIAETMTKDKATFEKIRELRKATFITIESTQSKSVRSSKTVKEKSKEVDEKKYEIYFNFRSSEKNIKPHQTLAINRGEAQKVLSVKICIPDWFMQRLKHHCMQRYNIAARASLLHGKLLEDSFNDAYNRLIKPLVVRQVRHEMNEQAERASIEVFANNLKRLLLTPPFRGKTVLGIDPGFSHGCKLAVVSEQGNVLDTATIYPHGKYGSKIQQDTDKFVSFVRKYNCSTLALGNATACRETETFITGLIQSGAFAPLDVSYTIINEAGASIYSCSQEAKSEFPNMDPNLISAISIARRLQDPLPELVKVEPKHLGVGMYQHDLPEKQLQLTLNEVISETVSFVGVDINTASHCLLRRVAGLNASRAASIIDHRMKSGPFKSRQQLMEVKGIGKKSFEQCAGFIRVVPETAKTGDEPRNSKHSLNHLDQTWIHPESYDVARRFLAACKCNISDIGSRDFINKVSSYASVGIKSLAQQFFTNETTMEIIVKGLSMERGEDIRVKEEAPLFRKNLRSIDDLSVGVKLSGLVRNVTHFGAFVDTGVGRDGLIPAGRMRGQTVSLGQRVEVEVISVEKDRNRIAFDLLATL